MLCRTPDPGREGRYQLAGNPADTTRPGRHADYRRPQQLLSGRPPGGIPAAWLHQSGAPVSPLHSGSLQPLHLPFPGCQGLSGLRSGQRRSGAENSGRQGLAGQCFRAPGAGLPANRKGSGCHALAGLGSQPGDYRHPALVPGYSPSRNPWLPSVARMPWQCGDKAKVRPTVGSKLARTVVAM